MKKLILTLAIISTSAFAGRIPTLEEGLSISKKIESSQSVSDLISLVKSNKLDFIVVYSNDNSKMMSKVAGMSTFASSVIVERLNTWAPKGNIQENLSLLDAIITQGADVNLKQTDNTKYGGKEFWNGRATFVTMAAEACSLDAIKLLEKRGADLGAETFNWARAFNQATLRTLPMDQPCKDTAEYLLSKARMSDLYTIRSLLYSEAHGDKFLNGQDIDQSLNDNLKSQIFNMLRIKFSKLPDGEAPTQEWYEYFAEEVAKPYLSNSDWWAEQDDNHKAWACYLSTFDEAVTGFNTIGMTNDWLTSNSIGGPYIFAVFSKWMVNDFAGYCNSLK